MKVISDTTPINPLVLIGCAELLPALYQRIVIPKAVSKELEAVGPSNPAGVWLASSPSWLECRPVAIPSDLALSALDIGEQEAMALARELKGDLILMDDRHGRREAERHHLRVAGTLGVLAEAASRELINLPQTIEKLRQANFQVSPQLLEALLSADRSRPQCRRGRRDWKSSEGCAQH
jgi:predicted nucleic acid-binding protein